LVELLLSPLPRCDKTEQVIDLLKYLQRHVKGRLLIVWDGVTTHRSRRVRQYLESLHGKIWVERLPAYAPELNPVEYLWGYWKQHELPNLCARDLWQLSGWAAHALRRIRRKRFRLICAFWKQAELCFLTSACYAEVNNIRVTYGDHLARLLVLGQAALELQRFSLDLRNQLQGREVVCRV
jgi:transposase